MIVHYLTFGRAPALDQLQPAAVRLRPPHPRPVRAAAHFDAGRFVEQWGDDGHRNGWCLYKMGCKGRRPQFNCPIVRWNDGTSWPIGAGHGCVGCARRGSGTRMSPFYDRLPNVKMFGVDTMPRRSAWPPSASLPSATAVHGGGVMVRRDREKAAQRRRHGRPGRHRRARARRPEPAPPSDGAAQN